MYKFYPGERVKTRYRAAVPFSLQTVQDPPYFGTVLQLEMDGATPMYLVQWGGKKSGSWWVQQRYLSSEVRRTSFEKSLYSYLERTLNA